MSDDTGDKSYDPTDARVEQFRKQGRFAKSRDIGGVIATAAVMGVLSGSGSSILQCGQRLFAATLGDLGALERLGTISVIQNASTELVTMCGAAVLSAAGAGIAVGLAQSRFRTYPEMLEPDLGRMNPIGGFGRLFALKRGASETFVALLRVGVVASVAYYGLSREIGLLIQLGRMPLLGGVPAMLGALGRVAGLAVGALFLVSAVDYAQSWWTLSQEMMMTRKEREEESRQSDGDPKQKAKMKARARAMAKKRAQNAVKNADVIVTNPTHVAVALRYGDKDPAPVVIAKGHDEVALRIRAEARKHGIPILENRRLARALDAEVAVGRAVPAAHFAAVARILAFVYKLRGAKRGRGLKRNGR